MTDTVNYYEVLAPRIEKLINAMALKWEARWNAYKSIDDGMRIETLNFLKNNPRLTDELILECWQMYLNDNSVKLFIEKKHPIYFFFQSRNFDRYSAQAVHSLRGKQERITAPVTAGKTDKQMAEEVGERLKAIKALAAMKQQLGELKDESAAAKLGTI